MVAEAAEIFRWVVIYDKTHFIIVHLSVCYASVIIPQRMALERINFYIP